jgi:hypothetical protein
VHSDGGGGDGGGAAQTRRRSAYLATHRSRYRYAGMRERTSRLALNALKGQRKLWNVKERGTRQAYLPKKKVREERQ